MKEEEKNEVIPLWSISHAIVDTLIVLVKDNIKNLMFY